MKRNMKHLGVAQELIGICNYDHFKSEERGGIQKKKDRSIF